MSTNDDGPRITALVPASAILRRFAVVMGPTTAVLAAVVTLLYLQDLRHQEATLVSDAEHVSALRRSFLAQEFESVRTDLLHLAGQELLSRFLSGDVAARAELEREYVRFVTTKGVYSQLRCLDLSGQELVRVNLEADGPRVVPESALQSKASRYYFEKALKLSPGAVFVSPFDLNVEHGRIQQPLEPVVRFLTPVVDAAGEIRGILVLNYVGAHLLAKLKEIARGFRGECLLINGAGDYLQASDPALEWGDARGHGRSFRGDHPEAWQSLSTEPRGRLRAGADVLVFERLSAGAGGSSKAAPGDPGPLILVARIPEALIGARSSALAAQLLILGGGAWAIVAVLTLYWARSAAVREDQERRLAESETRLRRLSKQLLAAQEDERRQISRQLHDELGQLVTAIRLDVLSVSRGLSREQASQRLEHAVEGIDELLRSLHAIASDVRPCILDDLGLQDAIESHVSEYERRTGVAVRCDLRFRRRNVPATVGENVYRVLQEALSNAAEHARTSEVRALVEVNQSALHLTVEDSGAGFDPEIEREGSRLGLLGMQERVELLGGRFELESRVGEGTRIDVVIPLDESEE